jgi:hypothetical protein
MVKNIYKIINECINEINDGYSITKIKNTKFEYCDGVKYKIGNNDNTSTTSIDNVEHTQENTFYQGQIDKYKEYISNGGIIETFPVAEINIGEVSDLEDMITYLDDVDNFDEFWDNFHENEFLYELRDLYKLLDDDEYPQYSRINKRARRIDDVFPIEGRTKDENNLLPNLKLIFDYFEENKSYSLLDFNHRFAALRELGKKTVMVEVM